MITVKNLIQMKGSQLWFIRPDANVLQALELMTQKDIGALPVIDETKLVGIISERDIVQMLSNAKAFYPQETIEKHMNSRSDRNQPGYDCGRMHDLDDKLSHSSSACC